MKQLAQLTDEERRVLCAEALGLSNIQICGKSSYAYKADGNTTPLPDPDQSPADALALCDHLKSQGWSWTIFSNPTAFFYETPKGRCVKANEKTVPRAIVSAFLLAKGLAR